MSQDIHSQNIAKIKSKRKQSITDNNTKYKDNKKQNRHTSCIQCEYSDYTGLIKVCTDESMDSLESLSSFKNHADNPKSDQVNRIQNLLILQSEQVDNYRLKHNSVDPTSVNIEKGSLSRSTSFIESSHIHPQIFQTYYTTHIDPKANVTSCPAFMCDLSLSKFNQAWRKLREIVILSEDKNITEISDLTYNNSLLSWIQTLRKSIVNFSSWKQLCQETPEQYHYLVGDFRSGDLVLFMPGVIHHVIKSTDPSILRVKISSELVESTTRDSNLSAGSYKKDSRKFEEARQDSIHDNSEIDPSYIQMAQFSDQALIDVTQQLKRVGVVVLRQVFSANYFDRLYKSSIQYLHQILDLPDTLDLTNPTQASYLHNKQKRESLGINNKHIRRHADNSRTTIVPKDHGITGIGFHCKALYQAYHVSLSPLFSAIYWHLFNSRVHLVTDIGIHFQPPVA